MQTDEPQADLKYHLASACLSQFASETCQKGIAKDVHCVEGFHEKKKISGHPSGSKVG